MKHVINFVVLFSLLGVANQCHSQTTPVSNMPNPPELVTCDALNEQFANTLGQHSGHCLQDSECACFDAGGYLSTPCGGVTDRYTAVKMNELIKLSIANKCGPAVACAPWLCQPVCKAGFCVNKEPF
ncbi:MAG TPA: hypothetical protein VJC18_08375 [bacterium]|nr:hypothetical protein [bacterium]